MGTSGEGAGAGNGIVLTMHSTTAPPLAGTLAAMGFTSVVFTFRNFFEPMEQAEPHQEMAAMAVG